MDEEDGRPGPGARQSGPADVLRDAWLEFLCRTDHLTNSVPSRRESKSPCACRQHPSTLNSQLARPRRNPMKTYQGSEIRNVAVVGHAHSGKTTLIAALLHAAK